jgi:hypothetical protein
VRGLAFWNDDKNCLVAAIVASHDVPGTLDILTERNDLDAALVISEVVDIPSLKDWTTELKVWLGQRKFA